MWINLGHSREDMALLQPTHIYSLSTVVGKYPNNNRYPCRWVDWCLFLLLADGQCCIDLAIYAQQITLNLTLALLFVINEPTVHQNVTCFFVRKEKWEERLLIVTRVSYWFRKVWKYLSCVCGLHFWEERREQACKPFPTHPSIGFVCVVHPPWAAAWRGTVIKECLRWIQEHRVLGHNYREAGWYESLISAVQRCLGINCDILCVCVCID